ncbi:MAG: DUF58 domain-containing protein [Spirochaetia bacterium]
MSSYFGGAATFLFSFLLFLPFVSVGQLLYIVLTLKHTQDFSKDHPVKGSSVDYTMIITNEASLSALSIECLFKIEGPLKKESIPPQKFALGPGESKKIEYSLHCPYRGIYTMGLDKIVVTDFMGWFSYYPEVWQKTFYVYPKIIEIDPWYRGMKNEDSQSLSAVGGKLEDQASFRTLTEYRDGMPIRNISWKKFASLGEPYIKTFDKPHVPGVSIFPDFRKSTEETGAALLEAEDSTVEAIVAFLKHYLDNRVPVSISASGSHYINFYGDSPNSFPAIYKEMAKTRFDSDVSPLQVYMKSDFGEYANCQSLLFITHLYDPDFFAAFTRINNANPASAMIINTRAMSHEEMIFCMSYGDVMGQSVRILKSSQTIQEDLT